jgi:hypothetical protein
MRQEIVGTAAIVLLFGASAPVFSQTVPDPNRPTLQEQAQAEGESEPPENTAPLRKHSVQTPTGIQDRLWAEIPLNHTGVASARFRNARNPPHVLDIPTAERALARPALTRSDILPLVDITFRNQAADQKLILLFTAYVPADRGGDNAAIVQRRMRELRKDWHVGSCKKGDDDRWTCSVTMTIDRRQEVSVPVTLMAPVTERTERAERVKFKLAFFQENATPAQPEGYFSVVPSRFLIEPENQTSWSAAAELSASSNPDPGDDILSLNNRFSGTRKKDLAGKGLITGDVSLGSRATASIDLQFKKGQLGDPDSRKLITPRYQLDVFGLRPMVLSFGRFEFAKPSSGVAIAETGEGWRLAYQNFSVAHLINVDGGPATDETDKRNDREVLFQVQNVAALPRVLEGLNLLGTYGRARYEVKAAPTAIPADGSVAPATRPHGVDHQYWTYGFEALLSLAQGRVHGSMSAYDNRRTALNSNFERQRGQVLHTSWSWTHFGKVDADKQTRDIRYFVSADLAQAGDYAGEHQAFGPDVRFLSGLLGNLDESVGLGEGLANKRYLSLGYTDQRGSILWVVARTLLMIPESDIGSMSTNFTWHRYHSTNDAQRGSLGQEIDVTSDIETPAGVTSSVGLTYFRPDGVLRDVLFPVNVTRRGWWEVSAAVKVAFGE